MWFHFVSFILFFIVTVDYRPPDPLHGHNRGVLVSIIVLHYTAYTLWSASTSTLLVSLRLLWARSRGLPVLLPARWLVPARLLGLLLWGFAFLLPLSFFLLLVIIITLIIIIIIIFLLIIVFFLVIIFLFFFWLSLVLWRETRSEVDEREVRAVEIIEGNLRGGKGEEEI
jgi:hypothetical protein